MSVIYPLTNALACGSELDVQDEFEEAQEMCNIWEDEL